MALLPIRDRSFGYLPHSLSAEPCLLTPHRRHTSTSLLLSRCHGGEAEAGPWPRTGHGTEPRWLRRSAPSPRQCGWLARFYAPTATHGLVLSTRTASCPAALASPNCSSRVSGKSQAVLGRGISSSSHWLIRHKGRYFSHFFSSVVFPPCSWRTQEGCSHQGGPWSSALPSVPKSCGAHQKVPAWAHASPHFSSKLPLTTGKKLSPRQGGQWGCWQHSLAAHPHLKGFSQRRMPRAAALGGATLVLLPSLSLMAREDFLAVAQLGNGQ